MNLVGAALVVTAAAATSAGLIVALHPLLQRYALARPNARSSHREPTPQGAGIAVIAATLLAAGLVLFGARPNLSEFLSLLLLFGATGLIAVIGAIDDIHPLPVAPRLALQAVAACLVIAALPPGLRVIELLPWWLERALLLVAILWFVNLANFMDGIDWITVAEVIPVTAALVVLGAIGALPAQGTVVALALGGAMVGFAPFNRPVAKLFLGDVGSLPIGLLLAWMLVLLAGRGHLVAALLLPLVYVADATITLLRRLFARERVWEAHRGHFYQRATASGLSVVGIVVRIFAVNLLLGVLAVVSVLSRSPTTTGLAVTSGVFVVAWLLMTFSRVRR
jgi:UDP-N-acetylmuramyl pentapeptide phosphotransferase/UDP-N-acetylglucosamine-1-phosphate transferase